MPEPQDVQDLFQMYTVPAIVGGGKKATKLFGCTNCFVLATGEWTAVILAESVDPALTASDSTFTSSVSLYSLI